MPPKVYIILVNWNGWQHTVECLESLLALNYGNFTILICDNGSSDGSCEMINAWAVSRSFQITFADTDRPDLAAAHHGCAQLVMFPINSNLGFAAANNVALRYALARDDFSYAWLLNNDTIVHPDSLAQLVARMAEKTGAGMCGSTLIRYHDRHRIQAMGGGYYCRWIGLPWHLGQMRDAARTIRPERVERWMNYVVGASLLVSRSFLQEIGLLCEEYFLYFEETDWAIRSKGRYSLAYAPESIVYHKVGASIGTSSHPGKKSMVCDYYNIRNRIYFTRKFFPYALVTIYAMLSLSMAARILFGQWDRVSMIARLMLAGGRDGGAVVPRQG